MHSLIQNQKGMTLIELLIAMAISMVVAAGAYSVFFSTTRTARTQEQTSEVQQNLRVTMERLTQDIRQAGFGIPEDGTAVNFDDDSFSSPITVTNSNSAPDEITLLGVGRKVGTIKSISPSGGVIVVDHDLNGDDAYTGYQEERFDETFSKFESVLLPGGNYNSMRANLSIGGIEFLVATGYNTAGEKEVGIEFGKPVQDFPLNLPVYLILAYRYLIEDCDEDDGLDYPCLKREDYTELSGNGKRVVAEGIEDIQFAYGVDASPRDGKIDYPATGYNSSSFQSDPIDDSSIVAVRVSIVARSKTPAQTSESARPALEDRPAGTTDRYIRRTLTKTIKLRNPRSGA